MKNKEKISVLFVCMGNICRSPTAHGVFRKMVEDEGLSDRIEIDSAGTHSYHVGHPPDERAQSTALHRGLDMSDLRARKAKERDFDRFDLVLAMDRDNYAILESYTSSATAEKLRLFMEFAPDHWRTSEVPDPYYGGPNGFEQVFDMVEDASRGLISHLREIYKLP
ncbi:MAG: low molecular weight phosphotyrosine protein phosphatase [Gammaproteobacteria bacterium]|uniref:protein-tyrosine-phosphatase n=1 Tax=Candidatus Thiopontia autotrophica TaxID=2841688 RepID=A0A8J6TPP2_9GAMM|nr:low molecular weight phosphotyrosine protein phosphatase [Candidatus Thiopontia autotrophica]